MALLASPTNQQGDSRRTTASYNSKDDDSVQRPLTAAELHMQLVAEAEVPMELAALSRLKAWDTSTEGYSLEEVMSLVHWLDESLSSKPRERWWSAVLRLQSQTRIRLVLVAIVGFLLALIAVGAVSGGAMELSRVVTPDSKGALLADDEPVATGTAVHLRSLEDYDDLRASELRFARDVVFRHKGAFHFYRVATTSSLLDGGVRVVAEDGSTVRIIGDTVTLQPNGGAEEEVNPLETERFRNNNGALFGTLGSFAAWTSQ